MTALDHTQTQGLSGAPLSAPFSISHRCNHSDVGTGLAALLCGEGEPAERGDATTTKAPRPVPSFELAALLRGHDLTSAGGAEDARHDYRVWDLVGGDR